MIQQPEKGTMYNPATKLKSDDDPLAAWRNART
jgi:hypothetical protein